MRQRTFPSELILFWNHVTRRSQDLSFSRSVGTGRREPWERGWQAPLPFSAPPPERPGELARRLVRSFFPHALHVARIQFQTQA